MAAIYEAIAEQQIAYCTVPASYQESGQRIRLCDDILQHKLATCLDMALLYAGCLEAVGIHPLIVLIKGHAFAGGWLIPDTFPDSVNDDVALLTKRAGRGNQRNIARGDHLHECRSKYLVRCGLGGGQ